MADELDTLIQAARQSGKSTALEHYLEAHSALPGPRMNTQIVGIFADYAASLPNDLIQKILMQWTALSIEEAPINSPREILVSAAALTFGQIAIVHPEDSDVMITHLHCAACDPRWRVREVVAMAMQRLLKHSWAGTLRVLQAWADESDPLLIRAAAASIAEPPLLTNQTRGSEAVDIQRQAVNRFISFPNRKADGVVALRKALSFTISVATAAAPDPGFALLERLAALNDAEIRWIVRENLKKNRLHKWLDRIAKIEAIMKKQR